jgi:hypothetical protein
MHGTRAAAVNVRVPLASQIWERGSAMTPPYSAEGASVRPCAEERMKAIISAASRMASSQPV